MATLYTDMSILYTKPYLKQRGKPRSIGSVLYFQYNQTANSSLVIITLRAASRADTSPQNRTYVAILSGK